MWQSMHVQALHSRCDKWHQGREKCIKEEEKASRKRSSQVRGIPCSMWKKNSHFGNGKEKAHVGVHVAPMWMPLDFPLSSFILI